jgi:hypothetical protein
MSDRVLSKYLNRTGENSIAADAIEPEADGSEDLGAFGILRGQRDRAIMLELRRKTGDILAIGYGWIEKIEFVPSLITLHLPGQKILIKGRNLNVEARPQVRFFQGLTRHRVCWVQEAEQSAILQADRKSVVVEAIEW